MLCVLRYLYSYKTNPGSSLEAQRAEFDEVELLGDKGAGVLFRARGSPYPLFEYKIKSYSLFDFLASTK